tara:strand:+ start:550 stop:1434 length:885 start_codon:yes stop_codon:yes gene_type:complete
MFHTGNIYNQSSHFNHQTVVKNKMLFDINPEDRDLDKLLHSCTDPGDLEASLDGHALYKFAEAEDYRYNVAGVGNAASEENSLVSYMTERFQDTLGTTYEQISNSLLDHLQQHADCSAIYSYFRERIVEFRDDFIAEAKSQPDPTEEELKKFDFLKGPFFQRLDQAVEQIRKKQGSQENSEEEYVSPLSSTTYIVEKKKVGDAFANLYEVLNGFGPITFRGAEEKEYTRAEFTKFGSTFQDVVQPGNEFYVTAGDEEISIEFSPGTFNTNVRLQVSLYNEKKELKQQLEQLQVN